MLQKNISEAVAAITAMQQRGLYQVGIANVACPETPPVAWYLVLTRAEGSTVRCTLTFTGEDNAREHVSQTFDVSDPAFVERVVAHVLPRIQAYAADHVTVLIREAKGGKWQKFVPSAPMGGRRRKLSASKKRRLLHF